MAYLMELLRGATYLALAEGRATLDGEVLGRAFEQRLVSLRRGTANPFRDVGAGRRAEGAEGAEGAEQETSRADGTERV